MNVSFSSRGPPFAGYCAAPRSATSGCHATARAAAVGIGTQEAPASPGAEAAAPTGATAPSERASPPTALVALQWRLACSLWSAAVDGSGELKECSGGLRCETARSLPSTKFATI